MKNKIMNMIEGVPLLVYMVIIDYILVYIGAFDMNNKFVILNWLTVISSNIVIFIMTLLCFLDSKILNIKLIKTHNEK